MNGIIENSTLILKNEEGKKQIYYKLSEFNLDGKDNTFVLYTDYSEENGKVNIYYGMYEGENVVSVTDENDIKVILTYIETIEEEIMRDDAF